jgi:hypothetical protein
MPDMFALQEDVMRKQEELRTRFLKVGGNGQDIASLVTTQTVGEVLLVGGPRNRNAVLPADTRKGLIAAYFGVYRAQARFQAAMLGARS